MLQILSAKIHHVQKYNRLRFIPKFIFLKARRRDGVESLTILEESEFKVSIDNYNIVPKL